MTLSIRSGASALALALALAVAFGGSGDALAAAPKDKAAAKASVASARKSYELGKFEEAIGHYSKAYELSDLPALLFNIAQCHRQLKQYERAAFFYGRYLSLQPPPVDNEEVAKGLLKEMEDAAAAEAQAKSAPSPGLGLDLSGDSPPKNQAAAKDPGREPAAPAAVPAEALPAVPAPVPTQAQADAGTSTPLVKQWWLWTLVGAVVVGGAVTAGVLASGGSQATPPYTTLDDVHF
ncbi:MAG TPA: tetratricopeptide repeat protein [Myxococcales bacterium]|jgi:tetratricopeptide (TPR) repeat protein